MAERVQAAHPLLKVALLDPPGQALPCGSVANRGHGHHGVRGAAAVRLVGVPQQSGFVALGEHGHPALSKCCLEFVFMAPAHLVYLVHEQHAETSHMRRSNLNALDQRTVTRRVFGIEAGSTYAQLHVASDLDSPVENLVCSTRYRPYRAGVRGWPDSTCRMAPAAKPP